jgi:uncharacterized membrane protein YdjX (TVP38/TMEM64 family)
MVDDFRPMFLLLSGFTIYAGSAIVFNIPAIIIGGLGVLGFGIWLGIDFYKTFKENKKK